jgi:GTPase
LFERPQVGERAILIHVDFGEGDSQSRLQELLELSTSAGAEPVDSIITSRKSPDAKYFVGTGKADEILDLIKMHEAELVIFNHALSPSQERNLEKKFECRVVSRTGLILDIFSQRAQSFEGKLQVELAQLRHISTRLIRGWTHLERQKGGIGLRGPGETQLETDRRLLGDRIKLLKQRLVKVRNQRGQGRQSRKKAEIPTVSLVGYTNAGKSTLFNQLTTATVYAEDQLFATLDPTLRKISLPKHPTVILVDTVGFIRELPHDLVDAFRSTLQETIEADLLLHVIDSVNPEKDSHIHEVKKVLTEIGADDVAMLEVYNKIDLSEKSQVRVDRDDQGKPVRVWISAHKKLGLGELLNVIEECLSDDIVMTTLNVDFTQGQIRSQLFREKCINVERLNDDSTGWCFEVTMLRSTLHGLLKQYPDAISTEYEVIKEPW